MENNEKVKIKVDYTLDEKTNVYFTRIECLEYYGSKDIDDRSIFEMCNQYYHERYFNYSNINMLKKYTKRLIIDNAKQYIKERRNNLVEFETINKDNIKIKIDYFKNGNNEYYAIIKCLTINDIKDRNRNIFCISSRIGCFYNGIINTDNYTNLDDLKLKANEIVNNAINDFKNKTIKFIETENYEID